MTRLRIAKSSLAPALTHVARVVPTRTAEPIQRGVLLSVNGSALTISGFDPAAKVSAEAALTLDADTQTAAQTEVGSEESVDAGGEHKLLLPGAAFRDIVASLPNGTVTLTVTDGRCKVTSGRSSFSLPLMPVEEYPTLPKMPAVVGTIPAAVLAEAVHQVAVAAASDITPSPLLAGVRIEATKKSLLMVATDRYRASVREMAWKPGKDFTEFSTVVPARELSDVVKTLGKSGDVTISRTEGVFGLSNATQSSTIGELAGEYPAWRALFNGTAVHTVTLASADLAQAVARVSLVKDRPAPVVLTVTGDSVQLSATGSDGNGVDEVDAVVSGEPIELGINNAYLRDGLAGVPGDKATISMVSPIRPLVITGDGDDSYRYLVMPMKVAG